MSDFTKGKWEARSNGAITLSDGKWYIPCGITDATELDANARLIVAAPEMYSELILAMASLRDGDICAQRLADRIEALLARIDGKEADN